MSNLLRSVEMGFWNTFLPVEKSKKKNQKHAAHADTSDGVNLSFAEARQKPESLLELLGASAADQALSSAETVPVRVAQSPAPVYEGNTLITRLSQESFKRGQMLMVLSSSFLGVFIGILIAFFIK